MSTSERLLYIVAGLAALLLGGGFIVSGGSWLGMVVALGVGLLYGLAVRTGLVWLSTTGLVGGVLLVIVGVWMDLPLLLLLAGITLLLAAWQLVFLALRLQAFDKANISPNLERRHLLWLGGILLIGFLAGTAAMYVRVEIDLYTAMLLSLLAFGGLALTVRFLIWQNEKDRSDLY